MRICCFVFRGVRPAVAGREMDGAAILEKFDETFPTPCNFPRARVSWPRSRRRTRARFREQVEPLRETRRGAGEIRTRSDLRAQAADYFAAKRSCV